MNMLWIRSGLPFPPDTGVRIRSYFTMRALARNHRIDCVAFRDVADETQARAAAKEYCGRLTLAPPLPRRPRDSVAYRMAVLRSLLSPLPFTISSYTHPRARAAIETALKAERYDVAVLDFLTMARNLPIEVPCPLVYFSHNVEARIWERYVQNTAFLPLKALFFIEGMKTCRLERRIVRQSALTIAVSQTDRDYYAEHYGGRVGYVPTGVDTEHFRPAPEAEGRNRIVFVGGMEWRPNIDAVLFFCQSVYPLLKREIPDVQFVIVGRSPVASIRALAEKDTSILVTGTVDDVRPHVATAACAVVPIRMGSGTRLKIYELMAQGKAVISTTLGAEGLRYRDGENILIADEPQAFAKQVAHVLADQDFCRRVGVAARDFVVQNCSWDNVADRFAGLCEEAVQTWRPTRPT